MLNYLKLLYLNELVFKLLLKIQFSFFVSKISSSREEHTYLLLTIMEKTSVFCWWISKKIKNIMNIKKPIPIRELNLQQE